MTHSKWLPLAGLLALGLAAPADAAGVTADQIVIGSDFDLSGPASANQALMRDGTQMRFDEANEAGGINGRKIKFMVEDNGSQPQMAVRAVNKLIKDDQVFAIVNAFGSGPNAATVKRIVSAGVIDFAPWAASAVLHKIAGPTPLLFTTIPNYDTTTAAALGWMIDHFHIQRVGYIYQEGPLGDLVRAGVDQALKQRGLKLAAEAGYKVGDIDFSSQVARMKAADVQLIMTATLLREIVGVAREVKKIGWDVKILTAAPSRNGASVKIGKNLMEGIYGIGSWSATPPEMGPPASRKWAADFKRRFNNQEPDENALLAYAYADWLVRGIAAAGKDLTTDSAVAGLQKSTEDNVIFFQPLHFKDGHATPELVRVEQVKNGDWQAVSPSLIK
ncbi:MAG TPA: ABC transporter substrate-binding protein [Hyphomicrobiales bacterium]|nr:ABC transporter substrate-binding protein [Hyphomicrobiales bacterium]